MEAKRRWVLGIIGVVVLLSFLLSDGFRDTLSRRRSIQKNQKELSRLSTEIEEAQTKLSRLKNDPQEYERLVRQELGYMRPGEKEVRFFSKKTK